MLSNVISFLYILANIQKKKVFKKPTTTILKAQSENPVSQMQLKKLTFNYSIYDLWEHWAC